MNKKILKNIQLQANINERLLLAILTILMQKEKDVHKLYDACVESAKKYVNGGKNE